ncbi:PQQ-binding-like beta-propeller repeat protein [Streptomyces palmae]
MLEALRPEDPQRVGRYQIMARLGAGGMGQVYLGRSPGARPVAVKVVRPDLARDGEFRRRFAREVEAARRVNGAFTAGVVDADPNGSPAWLATVYVPGVSLGEAVAEHGPWPARSTLVLGAGLAEALEAIHAADVIHRDFKPSNILLANDGPRVIDFGISVAGEASVLTHTGMVIGTPGFMSPEQLTGDHVGPASDVFSLGAILAYTATGIGPFGTGAPHALHYRAVHEQPDLASLPPELREVVSACLAKQPDSRPTVTSLLDRLAAAGGIAEEGRTSPATLLLTDPRWMPATVAELVQEHATRALPPAPSPQASSTAPTTPVQSLTGQPGPATIPDTGEPASGQQPATVATPTQHTPSSRPLITRRRTLLAAVGTAAAAFTGWRLLDDTSATPHTPRPSAATSSPSKTLPPGFLWEFTPGAADLSYPTVSDGVVYVCSDRTVYAVDAKTGKQVWKSTVGTGLSSPTVFGSTAYASDWEGGVVHAVDTGTGRKIWDFTIIGQLSSSPVVAGDVVYLGSKDGVLYAVDARTGKQIWRFFTGGGGAHPTLVGDVVCAGGDNGVLHAVNVRTGKQSWTVHTADVLASVPLTAVSDGIVYAKSTGADQVHAVNAKSGREIWTSDVVGYFSDTASALMASGRLLYAGNGNHSLFALERKSGKKAWEFTVETDAGMTPAAIADGVVYVTTHDFDGSQNGNLYSLDAKTGMRIWKFSPKGQISSPLIVGKVLCVCAWDGTLHAVDARTGKTVQKFTIGEGAWGPVAADGVVYVANKKKLYAVQPAVPQG